MTTASQEDPGRSRGDRPGTDPGTDPGPDPRGQTRRYRPGTDPSAPVRPRPRGGPKVPPDRRGPNRERHAFVAGLGARRPGPQRGCRAGDPARMARREERAYREYVSDEQRSQALGAPQRGSLVGVEEGCPARELCDESRLRGHQLRMECVGPMSAATLRNDRAPREGGFCCYEQEKRRRPCGVAL
jgi:hypothetical protein